MIGYICTVHDLFQAVGSSLFATSVISHEDSVIELRTTVLVTCVKVTILTFVYIEAVLHNQGLQRKAGGKILSM